MSRTLSSSATTAALREMGAWPKTPALSRLRTSRRGAEYVEWIWHFTPTSSIVQSAHPGDNGIYVDLPGGGADQGDAGQIDGQAEITSARYDELLKILEAVIESAVRCNLASSNLG